MVGSDDLVKIVAGSLAGLIVFLIILAVIIYIVCGPRKGNSKSRHFQHLTTPTDSNQSRPSTLSQPEDPKLPKVGSNGLWLGSSAMYGQTPPQGYYVGKSKPVTVEFDSMARASSESKLVAAPGHVYQGNLRIYHSQQLPPVFEVYGDPRSPRYAMSEYRYPLYESNGDVSHSRAYLLEHSQNHSNQSSRKEHQQSNKQVRRSASDVTSNTTNQNRNMRNSPHNKVKHRGETAVVEVHHQTSVDPKQGSSKRSHTSSDKSSRAPYRDPNFILNNVSAIPKISPSRDNKNEIHFDANNLLSRERESQTTTIIEESDELDIGYRPYTYQGSLSTANISDKTPQKYENEIVARMEKIWEEKQMEEDKVLESKKHGQYNQSYSDDTEVETRVNRDPASSDRGNQRPSASRSNNDKKIHTVPVSPPVVSETPDLATQGKSITAEAFQFLDTYLSDDEDEHRVS